MRGIGNWIGSAAKEFINELGSEVQEITKDQAGTEADAPSAAPEAQGLEPQSAEFEDASETIGQLKEQLAATTGDDDVGWDEDEGPETSAEAAAPVPTPPAEQSHATAHQQQDFAAVRTEAASGIPLAEFEELQKKFSALQQRAGEAQQQLDASLRKLAEAESKQKAAEAQVVEMQQQLAEAQSAVSERDTRLTGALAELQQAKQQLQTSQQEAVQKEQSSQSAGREELEKVMSQLQQAEAEKARLGATCEELQARLRQKERSQSESSEKAAAKLRALSSTSEVGLDVREEMRSAVAGELEQSWSATDANLEQLLSALLQIKSTVNRIKDS
mmetsp:Transcript_48012/g.114108  ORF Transcript_48012/g.114108 Transcript_48012/m.114108 type:complete len:331 (-) Transcript_48012:38-1030(-)